MCKKATHGDNAEFIIRSDYHSEKYCAKLNDREEELSKNGWSLTWGKR